MKTFLSIGAGPGMGLATAERFAREGFQVILSARNEAKTEGLAEQLRAKGHRAEVRTVDAGEPSSVAALVSEVESAFGGIDVLHFNAASMRKATLADQPRERRRVELVELGLVHAPAPDHRPCRCRLQHGRRTGRVARHALSTRGVFLRLHRIVPTVRHLPGCLGGAKRSGLSLSPRRAQR